MTGARLGAVVAGVLIMLAIRPLGAGPGPGEIYFVFEDLGTLPGKTSSSAGAINDSKQVTGGSSSGTDDYLAFLWAPPGPMASFNQNASYGEDINNVGQVIGPKAASATAFRWTPPGSMTTMTGLGRQAYVQGINELGHVVGYGLSGNATVPVLWTSPGSPVGLGTLGGNIGYAEDINDAGVIVGASRKASGFNIHPFYWTQETGIKAMAELGFGGDSQAMAINADGEVVGVAPVSGGWLHAVWWPSPTSAPLDLGTLPGDSQSWARDINDNGTIVGDSWGASENAFYRSASGWRKLGGPASVTGAHATGVNANGDTVGYVYLSNGSAHAAAWWRYTVPPVTSQQQVNIPPFAVGPGPMTVTILGQRGQDVRTLDPSTITIGDGAIPEAGVARRDGVIRAQYADANRDGIADLILEFDKSELIANEDLNLATSELWVQGATWDRRQGMCGSGKVRVTN